MEEDQKLFDMCAKNFEKQREADQERLADNQKKWQCLERVAQDGGGKGA